MGSRMIRSTFRSTSGELSYLKREGKHPVLFIHGFTASSLIWKNMTRYLDPDLYLILPDLFGHGSSGLPELNGTSLNTHEIIKLQASALHELLLDLGVNDYSIVGSSLGGWIALELAVRFKHPTKVVLIDSAGVVPLSDSKFSAGFQDLLEEYSKERKGVAEVLKSVMFVSEPDNFVAEQSLLEDANFPVSVIWGEKDHILDISYGVELSKMLHNTQFHVIRGADHTPFRTHPKQVALIINNFLHKQ